MNNEMKRRVFLGTSIAALAGFPFVLHTFTQGRQQLPESEYLKNLEYYRRLTKFTTEAVEGPELFKWRLAPAQNKSQYISILEATCVSNGQPRPQSPDVFYLSEGSINTYLTKEEETILIGKDRRRAEFWPLETIDHPQQEFTLWLKNGKLVQIRNTNESGKKHCERNLVRQLAMNDLFPEIKIGTKTTKDVARLLPFDHRPTEYIACGYERINQHKTIHFKFYTRTVDVSELYQSEKNKLPNSDCKINHAEKGDAWFDIETGLLVLQQMEIGHYVVSDTKEETEEYLAKSTIMLS